MNKKRLLIVAALAAVAMLAASAPIVIPYLKSRAPAGSATSSGSTSEYAKKQARIKTHFGDMVARFFPDVAPKTVKNFCDLAQKGFYNGLVFHRVINGFMIQGGDPQGNGLGGPGYTIKAEFSSKPHIRGTLSMARAQNPDSAGSQFFIVHGAHADQLDGQYTVFGELVSGLSVLDQIATARCNGDRPLVPVAMESVTIEDAK